MYAIRTFRSADQQGHLSVHEKPSDRYYWQPLYSWNSMGVARPGVVYPGVVGRCIFVTSDDGCGIACAGFLRADFMAGVGIWSCKCGA